MECITCGNKIFNKVEKKVRDSNKHSIVECSKCGLVALSPRPSLAEEQKFYDKNLQSKNISLPEDLRTLKINVHDDTVRRANFLAKRCSKKKDILDVGSGDGFFLKEMQDRGYKITGLEISEERRKISKKITDVEVLNINLLKEIKSSFKKFDCVTLFHVLEHIVDPIFFLKNIKDNLIKKDGIIIIEVPNVEDLLVSENKKYHEFYWQRAHLSYFNSKTLSKLVKKSGFSIKNTCYIQRYGLENFMHWYITGKPQIDKPTFQIEGKYKWLEDYYKKYLCSIGKSDTLMIVAKN